jgi:small-conductance mechanosensitive channel
MNKVIHFFNSFGDLLLAHQSKLLASLVTIGILWVLRKILFSLLPRRKLNPQTQFKWRKNIQYGIYIVGIILIGQIWVEQFSSLSNFLGLVAAGIAIALKEPILDLAGWAFIIWRKPFEVGERIQMGPHAGDVIDIGTFQFTLIEIGNWVNADQPTGRALLIPNSRIFSQTLATYNHELDYIFHEIPVLLTFESDWKRAKKIFTELIKEKTTEHEEEFEKGIHRLSHKYVFPKQPFHAAVYTKVAESGVLLTLRYPCPTRARRALEEEIWELVLYAIQQDEHLHLAYPTIRYAT